ncbi:MAG TPA: TonB-dependent siderophore receptor [Nitrobacter sp.]|nr:TonB-dependent siderophore receptor [Nitrobacter sp.]
MRQGALGQRALRYEFRGSDFCNGVRKALIAALLATTAVIGGSAVPQSQALAQAQTSFNIPAGPLNRALAAFGRQSGIQLSYEASIASGKTSPGIQGAATREQAIARILQGSGLSYSFKDSRNVLITQPGATSSGGAAPAGAIPLDTIDVQGEQSSDPGRTEGTGAYTPSVTATATRLQLSPRETPQSISVITRQQIEDFNLNSVEKVLEQTPGIFVVKWDNGARAQYQSRGFTIQNFQYDGVPSYYDQTYPGGQSTANTVLYDRVEVLKGATGLMTGSGDPSATINMVRKKPTSTFQGYTTLGGGSWDDYRGELDVSGPLNKEGTVRGRFVTAYRDANSYLSHFHRKDATVYGVLEADLTPDTMLTVGVDYQNSKPTGSFQSRIWVFDKNGNFNGTPRSTNPVARWSTWEQYSHTVYSTLEHRFDNGWRAKLQLTDQLFGYDAKRGAGLIGFPDPVDGSGVSLNATRMAGKTRNAVADFYATGPVQILGRQHEVVVGGTVSNRRWKGSWDEFGVIAPIPNYYNFGGNVPEPNWQGAPAERYPGDETVRQHGFYATARLNLHDSFKLIVGSRLANYERLQGNILNMKVSNVVVPFVGAIYDLNENFSLYASYTDIFRPQSVQNEQGQSLDPQTGKNYEAGLKGEFFDKRLNTSLAYFIIEQNNYPLPSGGMTPSGGIAYRGVDGVRSEGFELEASGYITQNWQLHGGFTHRISRLNSIKVATITPENQFTIYNTYKFDGALDGLTLGGGARWMDITWGNMRNPVYGTALFTAPSYWVVDLMARYKFTDNLSATLNVGNLFEVDPLGETVWRPG